MHGVGYWEWAFHGAGCGFQAFWLEGWMFGCVVFLFALDFMNASGACYDG